MNNGMMGVPVAPPHPTGQPGVYRGDLKVEIGDMLSVDAWFWIIARVAARLRAAGESPATVKRYRWEATQGDTVIATARWVSITSTKGRK